MQASVWLVAVMLSGAEPAAPEVAVANVGPEPAPASTVTSAATVTPALPVTPAATPAAAAAPIPDPAAATTSAAAPAPDGPPLAEASPLVIFRREYPEGGALERLIEPSGDVVVHVVTPTGAVDSCEKVGSLFTLPVVTQEPAANGEVVEVGRDESGALVRWVVQADGEPRAVSLLAPGAFR